MKSLANSVGGTKFKVRTEVLLIDLASGDVRLQ
jgi:hypothetical protein